MIKTIKNFIFGILIGLLLVICIKVINITIIKKMNLYEYVNIIYFDDYNYNKPIEKNITHIDSRLAENYKKIVNIFLYMENNKYADLSFNTSNLNTIEDISFDYNSILSNETLGTSIKWTDVNNNKRCRILLNLGLIDIKDRDVITIVLLHEIAHSAYNIEHYDSEPDLMNTRFNSQYFNTDIKYIIQDFTIELNKYERKNN